MFRFVRPSRTRQKGGQRKPPTSNSTEMKFPFWLIKKELEKVNSERGEGKVRAIIRRRLESERTRKAV
jgi:hypothetical protein